MDRNTDNHTPGELDVSPAGYRQITTDEGLDRHGYPVLPTTERPTEQKKGAGQW